MHRTFARGSLLLAVALGASMIVIAPGGAAAPLQKCGKFTGTITLNPGLTLVPHNQTATGKGTLTPCAPKAKTGGSGVLNPKIKIANGSCQGLATGKQTLKLAATLKWKNGKSSTMALTAKTGTGATATIATITGSVTKGLFLKHKVTAQIKVTQKAGENCTPTQPVKHLTFKNTKPFVIL